MTETIIRSRIAVSTEGTHMHGGCKPIICVELHRAFNSLTDTAKFFGVSVPTIWYALNGTCNTVGLWELDENGNKVRRIGKYHIMYATDGEVVELLLAHGRGTVDALDAEKARNAELSKQIAELKTKDTHYAWLEMEMAIVKSNNAELQRLAAIGKAYLEREERKRKANERIIALKAELASAETELSELETEVVA